MKLRIKYAYLTAIVSFLFGAALSVTGYWYYDTHQDPERSYLRKLAKCDALQSREANLLCLERVGTAPAQEVSKRRDESDERNWKFVDSAKRWRYLEEVDPITDATTYWTHLNADSGRNPSGRLLYMGVRCGKGSVGFYVGWGRDSSLEPDGFFWSSSKGVVFRIDDAEPENQKWEVGSNGDARFLYSPEDRDLLGRMAVAEKFVFRLTPNKEGESVTAEYDTKGLMPALDKGCRDALGDDFFAEWDQAEAQAKAKREAEAEARAERVAAARAEREAEARAREERETAARAERETAARAEREATACNTIKAPSHSEGAQLRRWVRVQQPNPIDDTCTISLKLFSEDALSRARASSFSLAFEDHIYVLCKSNVTTLSVDLAPLSPSLLPRRGYRGDVLVRFGDARAEHQTWERVAGDNYAPFKGSAVDFLKKAAQHDKLVIQESSGRETPTTLIFNTSEAKENLKPIAEECNWSLD